MRLFSKPAAILDEIASLQQAEKDRREDRAIVSGFLNGSPPLTDAEAEELGFTSNVNHLFGKKEIDEAADQMFGLYTKPANLLEVELDSAPPGKGLDWGMQATLEASRVLRKIEGFKTQYQGVCGDAGMHGEGVFFYPNSTFPLPRQCPLSKILIPDDSSCDVLELTNFAVETTLPLREIHRHWKGESSGWDKAALGALLEKIYENQLIEGSAIDPNNLEELEYKRQENSARSSEFRRRPSVQVVYFYQQRCDKPGYPFDLTVTLATQENAGKDPKANQVLYEKEAVIAGVKDILHPLFMDTIIGGAPKWHRVMGLGTLNYSLYQSIEVLINRAKQATHEGSMNLWVANDTTTREAAQQILLKHNGVIPEGLSLAQNRFAPNFGGILEMIQFFRQAGAKNARGTTPNNGDQNNQLEVQAIAEMNSGASASANRTSNWYDYMDRMLTEAFSRLTNPYIMPNDPGYSEIMDFQAAMKRRGIPLYWLQPGNVNVKAVRLIGDGVRHKEVGAAQFLMQNRAQYAPEVQPKITRIATGLMLDNYRLAEELTPISEEPDQTQASRADDENAVMLQMRKSLPPNADDIDELHVIGHFPAMELLIRDGVQYQESSFTPQQAEAFQSIGAHVYNHIQRIEQRAQNIANDPERDTARSFMEHLNQVAAMGTKLLNNLKQKQEGDQQKIDPVEQAKLEIEIQQLSLARDKLSHQVEKFQRTQNTREQDMAFKQVLAMGQDRRANQIANRQSAAKDAELALKISQAKDPAA